MPRIYELPASSTPENRSLVIEHAPSFRQQPQRPQGSADPRQMMAGQMDMELNNVTRWFDSQVSILDQGQLEPDKYKAEYIKLQRQAANQRVAIQAKHQAAAQQIKNMQKLVEDRMLTPEQMQATMLVMAGVPVEHVRRAFAQQQRQKPSTQLNEIDSQLKKIAGFVDQFDDYREDPWWKPGKKGTIWFTPKIGGEKTGPRRELKEGELKALEDAKDRAAELRQARWKIFETMTPLEQYAQRGSRAVERFGMGRAPMPTGRWGGVQVPESAPKKKQKPIRQRNKRTGEERISYDGGKTWEML